MWSAVNAEEGRIVFKTFLQSVRAAQETLFRMLVGEG